MFTRSAKKPENDTVEAVAKHIEKRKIKYPVFHDHEGTVSKALGVKRSPRAYLLDATGRVTWEGWLTGKRIEEVEALLRESLESKQAEEPEEPAGEKPEDERKKPDEK